MATPVLAGKLRVDSTDLGQFTDLKVTRAASSTVAGNEATIDLSVLSQTSSTAAVPVLTLSQSDVDEAVVAINCDTPGTINCTSDYSTTAAAKVGAIKVKVNGAYRYLRTYSGPN